MSSAIDARAERSRLSGPGVVAAVIGGLAVVLVAVLLLLDRMQVQSQQELDDVEFGMPLNWMTQEQGIDPPLPYSTQFLSPWENPTTIDAPSLVLNVIVVALVLAGVYGAALMVRSRRSTK